MKIDYIKFSKSLQVTSEDIFSLHITTNNQAHKYSLIPINQPIVLDSLKE